MNEAAIHQESEMLMQMDSAEAALSFLNTSENFKDTQDFGGPKIEHFLKDGEWYQKNGDEEINITQRIESGKEAGLAEHKEILKNLNEKGFHIQIKKSSEVLSGTEEKKQDYEEKVFATIFVREGQLINMRIFDGTLLELKEVFEDLNRAEDDYDDYVDNEQIPKAQPASLSTGLPISQDKKPQEQNESAWDNFWNNLLKPESDENQNKQPMSQNIFNLFTTVSAETTFAPLATLPTPALKPVTTLYLNSWLSTSEMPKMETKPTNPQITTAPKETLQTQHIITLSEVLGYDDGTTEQEQEQEQDATLKLPLDISIMKSNVDKVVNPVSLTAEALTKPQDQPEQQTESDYQFSSIVSLAETSKAVNVKVLKKDPVIIPSKINIKPAKPKDSPSIIRTNNTQTRDAIPLDVFISLAPTLSETPPTSHTNQEKSDLIPKPTAKMTAEPALTELTTNKTENSTINTIQIKEESENLDKVKQQPNSKVQDIKLIEPVITVQENEQDKPAETIPEIIVQETLILEQTFEQSERADNKKEQTDKFNIKTSYPVKAKADKPATNIKKGQATATQKTQIVIKALSSLTSEPRALEITSFTSEIVDRQEVAATKLQETKQQRITISRQPAFERFSQFQETQGTQDAEQESEISVTNLAVTKETAKTPQTKELPLQKQVERVKPEITTTKPAQLKTTEKTSVNKNIVKLTEQVRDLNKVIAKKTPKTATILKSAPQKTAAPTRLNTALRLNSFQKQESRTTIQNLEKIITRLNRVNIESPSAKKKLEFVRQPQSWNLDNEKVSSALPKITKPTKTNQFAKGEHLRQTTYSPALALQAADDIQTSAPAQQAVISIAE